MPPRAAQPCCVRSADSARLSIGRRSRGLDLTAVYPATSVFQPKCASADPLETSTPEAYITDALAPDDITFEVVAEETDHPVATVSFGTPAGEIKIMAELEEQGQTLRLVGLHIQGAIANAIGVANLRILADAVMEKTDYDAIEIEGAVRTTGASPGHRPGRLRFTRRSGPASVP
jgi:hypothetical protein